MRRCRRLIGAGVALVILGSCGVPLESSPEAIPAEDLPDGLRAPASTEPAEVVDREPVDVWFVRDAVLRPSRHRVDPPVTPQAALAELLSGPTEAEQNRALRSAIPDADAVIAVDVAGGLAIVELAPTFADIPASDQVLAVGQIVLTLTDQRGVGRVRFVVEEDTIAVPLPSGDTADDSVSRDDYLALVASDS